MGNWQDAILIYVELLPVLEQVFGEDDPDTVSTRNNLEEAYRIVGQE